MRFLYKSACDTCANNSNILGDGPGGSGEDMVLFGGCVGGVGSGVVVVMVVVVW